MTKTCPKCERTLPVDGFGSATKSKDGLQSWCRDCMMQWRQDNKDKWAEYQRRYWAKPENKERRRRRQREYRKLPHVVEATRIRNRNYRRHQRATHPLILRLKEVKSQPCVDCGRCYPPEVMDLDHIGDKEFSLTITRVVQPDMTAARMEAELAKCEVRCPTCHRLRHYNDGSIGRNLAKAA